MAVRNHFSPIAPIVVGVLVLLLGILACVLPYWMCWEIDAKNFTPSWGAGITNAINTNNPEAGSTVNAGLWWSDSEVRTGGQTTCSLASASDCVCNKIKDASDRLRSNARDLLTNDPNDNDVDDATFNGHNSPIECWDSELDNCDATTATNGLVTFTTKLSLKCDPQVLAPELRCGVEYADDDSNVVQNAVAGAVPVVARATTQSQSSTCGTTKVDDCMVDWINVSKVAYILAGLLLILNLLLYAMSGSKHPMKLPKWVLLCMLCSVLVFICLLVAFIAANMAFRWGCDNDWDRLEGDISYGAAFYFGLFAFLLAFLLIILGLSSWKKAKSIRDQYMYDFYSNPKYENYPPAYGYDNAYDANSYGAAYPATNYAYGAADGYGYGADAGYGASAPEFEYGEKGVGEGEFGEYEQEAMPSDADIGYGGIPMEEPIEYETPEYVE